MTEVKKVETIDEYLAKCAPELQERLATLRKVIHEAAPESTEKISYQMPTFYLNGNLVHFAVAKHHIGFYPTPSAISAFSTQLSTYKTSKGAVQFPLNQPLPYELIAEMVRFRVTENQKNQVDD